MRALPQEWEAVMAGIPPVINVTNLNGSNGFRILGSGIDETAGWSVGMGDFNGDGFADVIVGAPGVPLNSWEASDYGAYVIFGRGADDIPVAPSVATGNNFDLTGVFRLAGGAVFPSQGALTGYAVSYAGDFNGDGVGDLMVSAPYYGASQQGATYIAFGKVGSAAAAPAPIRIDGAAQYDMSGRSVASLGDVNGDGFDDVLISASAADASGRLDAGVSYVVYGSASGANINLANFNASQGFRIIGGSQGDLAGYSVSAAGDVNGDGRTDLIIGAINTNGYLTGSAYLVYGTDSGADIDLANLTPSQGVRFDGEFESQTGFSVAAAGDVNGDGLADIIIGAPSPLSFPGQGGGSAFVVFGTVGGLANTDLANLAPGEGFRINGAAVGDKAGYAVSSAGDFNGDGFGDLIIGAPGADPGGNTDAGSAYVIFGKASGFGDIDLANLSAADGFRIDGPSGIQGNLGFELPAELGTSVAGAGDINGDGYSDIVVGAPGFSLSEGAAYVIYGEASSAINKVGTNGIDRLFGGDFDDTLSGGDGNDVVGGKGGNNVLTGGAGSDAFVYALSDQHHDIVNDFRQGEDVIDLRAANISDFATVPQLLSNDAHGNAVITTVSNGATSAITLTGISAEQLTAADFMFAGNINQTLNGSDSADDLFGGGGGDILKGNAGDDRLFGEQGFDNLNGGAGNDSLFGGQDNDSLEGSAGADLLDGGAGIDEATYRTAPAGVTASLASGGTGGDAAGDVYVSIENMWGSNFDDVLEGDDQANRIFGLDGNNVIRGGGGNDALYGANGNDAFYGGAGADSFDGGGGIDYARYDDAATGVTVGFASAAGSNDGAGDTLLNIEGIIGSAFADKLGGANAAENIQGGGGDDLLQGRVGNDTLDGGDDVDQAVYSGSRGEYFVGFDAATETYVVKDLRQGSPDGTDQVRNVETFVFADGAISAGSVLDGNPGPIIGDDGDNTLTGTSIANEIRGFGGNDNLAGLAGEDRLEGGDGDDTLDGGTGVDTATYASAGAGVTVGLAIAGAQNTGGAGTDTLVSIENLTGSAFDDQLTGSAGANVLSGLAGNDRLDGAGGIDTLLGGDGDDILIGGAAGGILDGGAGFDLISYETSTTGGYIDLGERASRGDFASIEGVIGSSFGDIIIGSGADETIIGVGGNDVIYASGGTDTISGGAGDDTFFDMGGIEHFDGGDGVDLVAYLGVPVELTVDPENYSYVITGVGVTADLADPSRNTGFAAGDSYDGIEVLIGSYVDDELAGDEQDNTLRGSWGDDVIWGRGGNDLLEGDVGNDRLIGGAGADVLYGNVDFLGYLDLVGRLLGPIGADLIQQAKDMAAGDPVFSAGDGFDVASYETATSGVVASLTNPAINTGDAAGDTYILIEGLAGSAFDDTLIGTAGWGAEAHNRLEGGAGNDTLIGLGGDDDYDGGTGNDTAVLSENRAAYTITYDAATLTFTLTSASGVNHVKGVETLQFADGTLSVASLFAGGDNNDSLTGTAGQDDLNGGGGNDALRALGGDDRLDGAAGDDLLSGGDGNDTLIGGVGRDAASYADATAAVRVDLGATGAQATGGGGTDTLTWIEDVVGSTFADTLIGNAGDNALHGGAGDDQLIGLGGNDTFDGGAGIDTVSFAANVNSITTVDLALTGPQSVGGFEGLDTFVNIENVVASSYWGGTLKGDSGANWLTGGINPSTLMGRGGDDVLDGHNGWQDTASYAEASTGVTVDLAISGPQNTGEGNDTLIGIENLTGSAFGDTLKGTSGDNILIGGAGDDTLFGRGGFNRLDGGDGIDTVFYVDAATGVQVNLNPGSAFNQDTLINIENVVGSAFADTLTGDAGANALSGGAGNDVFTGGLGRDSLTGGAGNDVFDYNALADSTVGAGNRDVIADFQSGLDDIDLTGIDADTGRSGDQGFRLIGAKGFSGKAGELHYEIFNQPGAATVTIVSGDINGDRVADFEIEIAGIVNLRSSDFLL
jgi:Ca2+-binding RTX toxin-like protein